MAKHAAPASAETRQAAALQAILIRQGKTKEAAAARRDLAAHQILDHTRYVLRSSPALTPTQVRAIIAVLRNPAA